MKQSFSASKIAELVVRHRWLAALFLVAVTALFIFSMKRVVFDNSHDIWFVEGDESVAVMKEMEKHFGNDEFVSVFISSNKEGKFTPEMLNLIKQLAEELEETVPYVKKMTWLGTAEWIESGNNELRIGGYMENIPENQAQADAVLAKALTEPSYVSSIISKDKTMLSIYLDMFPYPADGSDINPRITVATAVHKVMEKEKYKPLELYAFGGPNAQYDYDRLVGQDGKKLFLASIAVMLGLLFWLGRGIRAVVIPIAVVVIAVFWTIGSLPILGYTANMLTIIVPTLLICVGIADSMHYIASFYDCADEGMSRKDAIIGGYAKSANAMLFTSLTTAAGFFSFIVTHIKPYREMGIYIAAGVIFALFITIILVPFGYSFGKDAVKLKIISKKSAEGDFFDRLLQKIHKLVITYPKSIIAVFALLFVFFAYGAMQVQLESNTLKLVKKGTPYRDNMDFVGEKMGGIMSVEFMLDTKKTDGIKNAAFMENLNKFQEYLEGQKEAVKVISIADVMKKMRKAMHNNEQEYYSIPHSDDAVSQYLLMYEGSGGGDVNKMISFQSDKTRVIVRTPAISTAECRSLHDKAIKKAHELFGKDVEISMSGSVYRYLKLNDLLVEAQKSSFIAAMAAVFVLMLIVMRSFRLGVISMMPNIFPVVAALGIAGLTGMYVDVILLCFAPIIIGVSVDDTIHFFTRFSTEFKKTGRYSESVKRTHLSVGRPIIFTSIVLVIGFMPLGLSVLTGYIKMAFMFGWAFSWALLADLIMGPALIMLIKPLGKEKQ